MGKNESKNKQTYKNTARFSWVGVSYLTETQLQEVITSLSLSGQLKHYMYILHYKEKCVAHFHICVTFHSKIQYYDLMPFFGGFFDSERKAVNTLMTPNYRPDGTYNYFLHHEQTNKELYEESEIVSDDLDFFKNYTPELKVDRVGNAITDLMNGVSIIDCINAYGRDFVIYYPRYKELLIDLGYMYSTKNKNFTKGDV